MARNEVDPLEAARAEASAPERKTDNNSSSDRDAVESAREEEGEEDEEQPTPPSQHPEWSNLPSVQRVFSPPCCTGLRRNRKRDYRPCHPRSAVDGKGVADDIIH